MGASSFVWAGQRTNYPVPPETENRLFYLQRSTNSNTVVYDANRLKNGKLDSEQPVNIYWLRYNTNGERRALNFAERNFAYGLTFEPINSGKYYIIKLMAYAERTIRISVSKEGKAEAHTQIKGKQARLKNIYIDVEGSGFWSSVNYIELTGMDVVSGKKISERFVPESVESDWF